MNWILVEISRKSQKFQPNLDIFVSSSVVDLRKLNVILFQFETIDDASVHLPKFIAEV